MVGFPEGLLPRVVVLTGGGWWGVVVFFPLVCVEWVWVGGITRVVVLVWDTEPVDLEDLDRLWRGFPGASARDPWIP